MLELRFTSTAQPAQPSTGGHEVLPAAIALSLADALRRLEVFRERQLRYSAPPPEPGQGMEAILARGRHRAYLMWSQAVAELEGAAERGESVEYGGSAAVLRWCGWLVLNKQFLRAACPACGRTYGPEECAVREWSVVADARAGFAGRRLVCRAGHTLFLRETWVA